MLRHKVQTRNMELRLCTKTHILHKLGRVIHIKVKVYIVFMGKQLDQFYSLFESEIDYSFISQLDSLRRCMSRTRGGRYWYGS